jgi:hypothetical protein
LFVVVTCCYPRFFACFSWQVMLVVFAAIVDIVVFPSPPKKTKTKNKTRQCLELNSSTTDYLPNWGQSRLPVYSVAGGVWSVFFSFCREKHTNLKYADDAFPRLKVPFPIRDINWRRTINIRSFRRRRRGGSQSGPWMSLKVAHNQRCRIHHPPRSKGTTTVFEGWTTARRLQQQWHSET